MTNVTWWGHRQIGSLLFATTDSIIITDAGAVGANAAKLASRRIGFLDLTASPHFARGSPRAQRAGDAEMDEILRIGEKEVGRDWVDTTPQSIDQVERSIAELEKILADYENR